MKLKKLSGAGVGCLSVILVLPLLLIDDALAARGGGGGGRGGGWRRFLAAGAGGQRRVLAPECRAVVESRQPVVQPRTGFAPSRGDE